MSGLFLLICIIGMAIQGAFILVERKENYRLALILKTVASMIFILAGFYSMQNCGDKTHAWLVVAGLIMGGVGDFFLNLQFVVKEEVKEKLFVVGAVAFFVGHILYNVSLFPYVQNVLGVGIAITVVFTAVVMPRIYRHIKAPFGLEVFGVFYIGAVVLVTVLAAGRFILQPVSIASLVFAIGGALFTASDIVLIFDVFGNKKVWMRTVNLVLYYLAQLVIASSLLFVM